MMATIHNTPPPPIPMGHMNPPPNSANFGQQNQFQSLQFKPFKPPDGDYDGKRLRKSVMRKTVDYNSSVIQMLESRIWQRDERDRPALPADISYASHILPPPAYLTNPVNAVVTKFVRSSTNKAKCPIFCLAWTPEGRRLVTGASSGEFTLWNGLTFNFETILQAHESSVRAMVWSHNDQWMVTGDTSGYIKYWQSNMNNVKMFQAHKDPVRGLSFSPSDLKIASGSDDGTVRIWDFYRCQEENVLIGHGSDVKCVDWHPSKSLLASGSKDNQQPIKLWDPRTGSALAQLHAHKSTVMDLKWNSNGMWLCSASRDHLLKLFDIRNFSQELQVFRGHKKEASSIAWHPQHEGHFASGGSDGSILFWHVGYDKEVGAIESAHDGIIWDMAWHPLGHILCSGSNDHASKFWTRNRPGDKMRDRYNLNTLPPGVVGDDCVDIDDIPMSVGPYAPSGAIPGMGPEDKIEETEIESTVPETIPGLEFDALSFERMMKKTPYAKPIPKTFQAAWNAAGGLDDLPDQDNTSWVIIEMEKLFNKFPSTEGEPFVTETGINFPPGTVPLSEVKADAIAYYGFYIPLAKVPANEIQDAFAFFDEEEALSQLTSDADFARKLVREKRGLYNPTSNQGLEDKKDSDSKSSRPPLIQNNSNMPPPNHFKNAPPNQNYPQQNYQNQQSFNQPPFYSQPPNRPPNGREDFDYNREEGWNRNYNRDNFKQNSQRQNSQDFQNRMPHNQRGFGPPMGDGRNRDGYDQRNDDRGQNYNDRMDGYGNEDYRQMQNYSDDYPDRGRRGDDYSDRGRRGDDYPNRGRRGDYPNRRDDYPDRRGDDNDRRDNYNEKRNDYQDRGRRGGFQNPRGRGGGYNDRRDNFQGDRDARRSFQRDSYGNEDDDYCQEENQPQGKDWGDRLQGRPRERDYDGDRRNKRRDGDDRRGGGGGRSSGKMRSRGGGRGRSRGDGGGNRPHRNRDNY